MVSEYLVDRGAQQNSAPPFIPDVRVAAHLARVSKVISTRGTRSGNNQSQPWSIIAGGGYEHWIGRPVGGRAAIRLGDTVGAEVKSA